MEEKVRVRYAPSPTGHLHIGNARTALFNYLFAKHNNGEFIIRIEDTDTKRNIQDGERSQLENLKWLGITWDESPENPGEYGPYRQSERKEIYNSYIQDLLDRDLAYKCYCTEEELENVREQQRENGVMPHYPGTCSHLTKDEQQKLEAEGREYVIRFRVPTDKTYQFEDMVKGPITFESKSVGGDFIIQKRDGMPTYNFAVAIDDHLMKITHVLRGDDHIANTPKQLMIYEAFGFKPPKFGHMTLIINSETGKKLSKRDETILQFIEQYRELGYLPEAMFNFISLLGWSPEGEEEIFSQDQFIQMFDTDRLSKSPAAFDSKKLEWINNSYMKQLDLSTATNLCMPYLQEAYDLSNKSQEWIQKLVSLYQPQMSYAKEIVELSQMFFNDSETLSEQEIEVLSEDTSKVVVEEFKQRINDLSEEEYHADNIKKIIKSIQKDTNIKGRKLFMPIRIATTGMMHGPELPESIELLGKSKVLNNIEQHLKSL